MQLEFSCTHLYKSNQQCLQDAACGLFQKDTSRRQLLVKALFQYTDCFPGNFVLNAFPQLPASPPSQPAAAVLQVPSLSTGKVP